jgi:hypothetical protein
MCGLAIAQVPRSKHIIFVALENHSYEQVIGNGDMPYFNALASQYSLLTQHYANQHDSLPALMWFVAGQAVVSSGSDTSVHDVNNLVRQANKAGHSWKIYAEKLPSVGYMGGDTTSGYVRHHNPLIYFTDIANSSTQQKNVVPFENHFESDVSAGTLPEYSYVIPDRYNDAHVGSLADADKWLQQNLGPLISSTDFQQDGILIITFDEGELSPDWDGRNKGGRVATVIVGPQVKRGYKSTTFYRHQNVLRTVCDALALSSCPVAGATAAPISEVFGDSTPPPPPTTGTNYVELISPAPNSTGNTSPLHVQATAHDDATVKTMAVYLDGTKVYSVAGPMVDTSLTVSNGTHRLTAKAWDSAGRVISTSTSLGIGGTTSGGGGTATSCPAPSTSKSVNVCSPAADAAVSSPVHLLATARDDSAGITAMAVYVDSVKVYSVKSAAIDASLSIGSGTHSLTVKAWDSAGAVFGQRQTFTVP